MSKPETPEPLSGEITPQPLYLRRREFLKKAGLGALTAGATGAGLVWLTQGGPGVARSGRKDAASPEPVPPKILGRYSTDEKPTSYDDVTHYNNFYEFGTDKLDPAANAGKLRTRPWTVAIDGLVKKPLTVDIDQLLATSSGAWSRSPRRSTWPSRPCSTRSRCRCSARTSWSGRTWRACGWTRPRIR